jgi:2-oxoglutarate ferredoxin oxidoreductase subunit alpha
MVRLRAEKLERIARSLPDAQAVGDPEGGDLLVVGWGSTDGAVTGAVNVARRKGWSVSRLHLRYLNPLPKNLGEVLARFERVLVPELNLGQLAFLLQGRYVKPVISYAKVQGKPFTRQEIFNKIEQILEPESHVH